MACKMCFLTHNKDTNMKHVDIPTYLLQIRTVLDHYRKVTTPDPNNDSTKLELVDRCNVNFMSKGDAGATKYFNHYAYSA